MNTDIPNSVKELSQIEIEYQGESSWLEHGSFMYWMIKKLNPKIIVELGSHYGYSYFAACQSINANSLDTKAFAVDTWQGDQHAGFYGNEVYDVVNKINTQKYFLFSKLLRMTFDEGLNKFESTSIDLLHIDGLHTYDAVAHDFNSWKEKLSNRAIVLFHDIHEHSDDFEVNRFWLELQNKYPTFEFFHGHGLGVLKFGTEVTPLDFLFDNNLTESSNELLRYIFRSSGVYLSIGAQLKSKDKIIDMYYSDLMKQIELSNKYENAVEVLNEIIADIKKSISWKLTSPVRFLRKLKRN